jgi:SAM-dependent methyltransferase
VLDAAGTHYDRVVLADLEQGILEFEAESFDGILARDILEHLHEPWNMVNEIFRVAKPGGTVIASVPMAKPSVVWSDYTHVRGFTRKAIRSLFEDCGFRIRDLFPMGGYSLSDRLGMTRFMPFLMKMPGAGLLAVSYHLVADKPAGD